MVNQNVKYQNTHLNIKTQNYCFAFFMSLLTMIQNSFQKIRRLLDREVAVEDFIVDFEAATWKALRYVFGDDTQIHGCAFHWGQAVWRQVQV